MPLNLNATNVDITDPDLQEAFDDLQGGIVKSHGRDVAKHVFLRFVDAGAARTWLHEFAPLVTSATRQHADAVDWKANGTEHLFTSLMLTVAGYQTLGVDDAAIPLDKAFRAGMKDLETKYNTAPRGDHKPTANPLADDPSDWDPQFQGEIHALVLFAYGSDGHEDDESLARLDKEVSELESALAGVAEIVCVQHGHALRNDLGQVIEHFGFADGVSDPLMLKPDLDRAFENGGFEHWDPSMNLGGVLVPDPGGGPSACGSFAVYRKLQQNVKGFADRIAELATSLGMGVDEAGALVMGRFKDGTPVGEQSGDGWTNEFNDFNYDDDFTGLRCPLASHARRTNPRGDTYRRFGSPLTIERSRRIVRRAISYGPADLEPQDEWTETGLLFLCFQNNIEDQFIFIQHTWCNNQDFLRDGVGVDPVVGQVLPGEESVAQVWPSQWGRPLSEVPSEVSGYVRTRGGEYFFTPSLSALNAL